MQIENRLLHELLPNFQKLINQSIKDKLKANRKIGI